MGTNKTKIRGIKFRGELMKNLKFKLLFLVSVFTITNLSAQISNFTKSNELRRESIQKYLSTLIELEE